MIDPEDENYDINIERPIVDRDNLVAHLLGWKHANLDYAALPLMDQLRKYWDKAVREFLEAEKTKCAAKNPAENEAAIKILAEKLAVVNEYEGLIDKAKSYFSDITEEIAKGDDSALRIDQRSAEMINEEFFTLASVEWWVRKKYCRPLFFPASLTESSLPQANIKTDADINQKPSKLRDQEEAILAEIVKLGHDPKNLPKFIEGKKGVKNKVQVSLNNHPLFEAKTAFKHAWDNLLADDLIIYKK